MQNPKEIRRRQYQSMQPEQLVCLLLRKCITHVTGAKYAIQQRDYEQANNRLIDAQDILSLLSQNIISEDDGSQQAREVLDLLQQQLYFANIYKDLGRLEEALNYLRRLADITEYYR
ncbi:MAG: hypothetical protein HFG20_10600 [Anaerotruncus sp.]|nr:hypothetical protein [Anaerotruncus sp.]